MALPAPRLFFPRRPDRPGSGYPQTFHSSDRPAGSLWRSHSGLTTLHANDAQDALARLEAMCVGANLGLGLAEIRSLICSAVQVISVQHRIKSGARRITEIVELRGQEDGRYVLQPLFRYDPAADQIKQVGQASF